MIKTKYYIEKPINDDNKEIEYYYQSSDNLTKTALFRLTVFIRIPKTFNLRRHKNSRKRRRRILKFKTDGIYTDKEIEAFE